MQRLTLTEAGAVYIREVEATFVSLDMATEELRMRFGQPNREHPENASLTRTPGTS